MKKIKVTKKKRALYAMKTLFWFSAGAVLGLFFFISFLVIIFQRQYAHKVYPGVMVDSVDLSGKKENEVKAFFAQKNKTFSEISLTFSLENEIATISASGLYIGYNADLLAHQAYSVGRSDDVFSNVSIILQAYTQGIELPPTYQYSESALEAFLQPFAEKVKKEPVEALFSFENGIVVTFRPSQDGQALDIEKTKQLVYKKIPLLVQAMEPQEIYIALPIKNIRPKITTEEVNNLGIKELLATGTSVYPGSIESRIHNIQLAASRVTGILVAPGEEFSFNKVLGDISAATGYKQAYIIQNGKTILGDGGGVCQVSTTMYRALLNAGLPITERNQHAYRVRYYEQDSDPGFDAAIYSPGVDLKFKNDTGQHILIQNFNDTENQQLTFYIYGTKDNREVTISKPIIVSQTPAPEPLYQDDPTLPKGTVKQVDFAANGANVSFTRQVVKNGEKIIDEKVVSHFRPWKAVFLRGTKE